MDGVSGFFRNLGKRPVGMRIQKSWIACFLPAALILLITGCGAARKSLTPESWAEMEAVVRDRNFTFEARWAEPLPDNSLNQLANAGQIPPGSNANRINLINNANFLKMRGDSVEMALPYYGERQVTQTYGRAEGMQFEGVATDLETRKNEKRNYQDLDFNLKNKTEVLQCNLRIFNGLRAVLTIFSNQRNMIRYEGTLEVAE